MRLARVSEEVVAMTVEDTVAAHYTTGSLVERIMAALESLGVDPKALRPADLKPVDEFHMGGLEATEAFLAHLPIARETRVLDIGSGIGGTARLVAERHGARVLGVDLTPEFVETARALSEMASLGDRVRFETGSALALPVEERSVDLALMLHVGMNIADKAALMREVARVLRPGGTFAVFDVMTGDRPGVLTFPLPWASEPESSFVEAPDAYAEAGFGAGLRVVEVRDRTNFAEAYFDRVRRLIAQSGPPPLGIHLLMGPTAKQKIENVVAALGAGRIAPTEMVFRAG